MATIKYQVAYLRGELNVPCYADEDLAIVIARAKRLLRRRIGEFPYGAQSFTIISKRPQT